jgi:hypothetical protein
VRWYEWLIALGPYIVTCGPIAAAFWMMEEESISVYPSRSTSEVMDEIREHVYRIQNKL